MTTKCQELRERIVALVEGDLDRADDVRLRRHAAGCDACARELVLEEALVAALRSMPEVPDLDVPCPDPEPDGSPPLTLVDGARATPARRVRMQLAATAAAVAAVLLIAGAGLLGAFEPRAGEVEREGVASSPVTVEIRTILESDADVPLPDDDLLALTAGVEAVVMRRPARRR